MSTEVGKVSLGVKVDSSGVSKGTKKAADEAKKSLTTSFDEASKRIEAILNDTGRSMKSKAASIGAIYKAQGMSSSEAMRKAWEQIERGGDAASNAGPKLTLFGKKAVSAANSSSTAFSGLNSVLKKTATALVAVVSVKALVGFSKKCIDLGSDLAEVQNVVDVTFTSMNGKINEFAQNAAQKFGLSEIMAKRYTGTFGAMAKAFGFAEKDAAEMSMTLTGLAGDVASFYNIDQDAAYTKLKSVFSGETESLKDLGIVMTQTALDQYALQHGFGTTTAKMSEQQKVALRYQFILSKLSDVSGDFARTSNGWANQVRILKLQFESLCSVIGSVLIAALSPAIRGLNTFMGALVKAANTFKSFVFSLFGKESEDMAAGAGASMAALSDTVEDTMAGAEDAASGASDGLSGVGDAAKDAAKDAKKAAKEMQRSVAGFDIINKLGDTSSSSGNSGGSGGGSGSGAGSSGVSAALGDTASALKGTAYDVGSDGGPLDKLTEKLKALKDLFVGGFWKGFGDTAVLQSIKDNLRSIGDSLADILDDERVKAGAERYVKSLAYSLGQQVGALASIGSTVADNLTGGIAKALEQNKERVSDFLVRMFDISAETERIKGDFAQSVAEVFSVFRSDDAKQITADILTILGENFAGMAELGAKAGRDALNALTQPFMDNKNKLKEALENTLAPIRTVLDGAVSFVQTSWDAVQKLYDAHISPFLKSLTDGISEIVGTLLDGYNKHIAPVLDKLADKAVDVWRHHLSPMVTSLTDALGAVVDLLKTCWEQVLKPLLNWITDKVMPVLAPIVELLGGALLDAIGGIANGIKTVADWVKTGADALSGWVNTAADTFKTMKAYILGFVDYVKDIKINFNPFSKDFGITLPDKDLEVYVNARAKQLGLDNKNVGVDATSKKVGVKNNDVTVDGTTKKVKVKNNDVTVKGTSKKLALTNNKVNVTATAPKLNLKDNTVKINLKYKNLNDKLIAHYSAVGGVYQAGKWHDIPQYAGGTTKAGSVFVAGEAGPEVVGHIGGHTEVLNKSQIASAIYGAVVSAMSRIENNFSRIAAQLGQLPAALQNSGSVRRNTPQLAMIGDNRQATTPEGKLLAMAKEAAASAGGSDPRIYSLLLELVTLLKTMPVYRIDEESLRKYFIRQTNRNTKTTGKCELMV